MPGAVSGGMYGLKETSTNLAYPWRQRSIHVFIGGCISSVECRARPAGCINSGWTSANISNIDQELATTHRSLVPAAITSTSLRSVSLCLLIGTWRLCFRFTDGCDATRSCYLSRHELDHHRTVRFVWPMNIAIDSQMATADGTDQQLHFKEA